MPGFTSGYEHVLHIHFIGESDPGFSCSVPGSMYIDGIAEPGGFFIVGLGGKNWNVNIILLHLVIGMPESFQG